MEEEVDEKGDMSWGPGRGGLWGADDVVKLCQLSKAAIASLPACLDKR